MRSSDEVIARAKRRLEAIESARIRIHAKMAHYSQDDPRQEGWKRRLAQFVESERHLKVELEFGKEFLLKGTPTPGGVRITPPTGKVDLDGR